MSSVSQSLGPDRRSLFEDPHEHQERQANAGEGWRPEKRRKAMRRSAGRCASGYRLARMRRHIVVERDADGPERRRAAPSLMVRRPLEKALEP